MALIPHQFADDHAKIMWALSFMKSGHAACFVDRQMRGYHNVGSLSYGSWREFIEEFITDFCPKNEIQTSRTELKTTKFFQGGQSIDEYVDDFCEIVQRACYFEGAHIILKFCKGLNPKIQDHVACVTEGEPSDDSPHQWYAAATLCDENHIANKAFQTSSWIAPLPPTPSNAFSVFRRPIPCIEHFPMPSHFTPPVLNVSGPP
jgi:hypothetical protein